MDTFYFERVILTYDKSTRSGSVEILRNVKPGYGTIWMEDLECVGDEDSVWKCPHTAQHDCDHNEDAAVTCYMLPSVPSKPIALWLLYFAGDGLG